MKFINKQISTTFTISALMLSGIMNAQSIQSGLNYLNRDQFSKAKEILQEITETNPTADNYYYMGYYYLKLDSPDVEKAKQNFDKGLAINSKSDLIRVGLATLQLYKGNKTQADADFEKILEDTRYRNADILYHISEAYILFNEKPQSFDLDSSIKYGEKLIEFTEERKRIKPEYYLLLGNAYYIKKQLGKAIPNYNKAAELANNKSTAYALIGNAWSRTQNKELTNENFKQALDSDPNNPIVYKLLKDCDIRVKDYTAAAKNLKKYIELTGNKGEYSLVDVAIWAYNAENYSGSAQILEDSWDLISEPLKYKLKALLLLKELDFKEAYENINQYLSYIPEAERRGADFGILGKIQSSLVQTLQGAEKEGLMQEAMANLTKASDKGDRTYDYQQLLRDLDPSSKLTVPTTRITNAKIEELKKILASNLQDTKAWYDLAIEQYNAEDYIGSMDSWDKLIALIPDWETSYAGKAMASYAYDMEDKNGIAEKNYIKYISLVEPKETYSEAEKSYLATAYVFFAYKEYYAGNKEEAKQNIEKTLKLNPQDQDALNLQKLLI